MRLLSHSGSLALLLSGSACSFSGGSGADPGPDLFADASIADAMEPPPGFSLVSLSFRDGVDYGGTLDNWLFEADDNGRGDRDTINWDLEHSEGGFLGIGVARGESVSLVSFEIFGAAPERVPPGSQIARALLVLVITDGGDQPTEMFEALAAWDESTSWDTLGPTPGPQAGEDYDELSSIPFETGGVDGAVALDVTNSVQRWSDGAANNGWLFNAGSDNGTDVRSREFDNESQRPALLVDYLIPDPE
jgi:hypothetical protein